MIETAPKRLLVASPRGLCAGVVRSVDAYNQALLTKPNSPLFSVGEPAHNTHINERYKQSGINFVSSVAEVPDGAITLLGPHGTEVDQLELAKEKGLTVLDTTCPLVTKVEDEIAKYTAAEIVTIYWGNPEHQEAKAAVSSGDVILIRNLEEAKSNEIFKIVSERKGVAFASQTTFNSDEALEIEDELKQIYPSLILPSVPDRCYATRNRQAGVKKMIQEGADFVVIVGSETSSNSKRLNEIALENDTDSILVDGPSEFNPDILLNHTIIGFESGASVEETIFQEVLAQARNRYNLQPEAIVVADESRIKFRKVKEVNYAPQFIQKP